MSTPAWETKLRADVEVLIAQAERDHKMLVLTNQNVIASISPPKSKPYAPGHYVFPTAGQQASNSPGSITIANINATSNLPSYLVNGVRGFLIRYPWRQLEASFGDYTNLFNVLDSYCDWAATVTCWDGSHPTIQLMIEDKSYDAATLMLPSYMDTLTYTSSGGVTSTNYEQPGNVGWSSVRWLAYVVNRYNTMIDALAARYDDPTGRGGNNAYFFGIATQETAIGQTATTNTNFDYTVTKFVNSYTSTTGYTDNSGTCTGGILYHACNAFQYSKISWFMNFMAGGNAQMTTVATNFSLFPNWIARKNIYSGGPDCEPESASLNATGSGTGKDAFPQYAGISALGVKTFITFSVPEYGDNPKYAPVHSTLSATSTAAVPSLTNITKAASAVITVNTVSATNPYAVGDIVFITGAGGMTQINNTAGTGWGVTAISGSSGAWKATLACNSSGFTAYTSGGTAPTYWTVQDTFNFAKNVPTPAFATHSTLLVSFMYWYVSSTAQIWDWSPDATAVIAANHTINP